MNTKTITRRRNINTQRIEKKLKSLEATNPAIGKPEENKLEKLKLELFALLESEDVEDRIEVIILISDIVKKLASDNCEIIRSTTANAYLGLNELIFDGSDSVKKTAQIKTKQLYSRT